LTQVAQGLGVGQEFLRQWRLVLRPGVGSLAAIAAHRGRSAIGGAADACATPANVRALITSPHAPRTVRNRRSAGPRPTLGIGLNERFERPVRACACFSA